MIIDDLGSEDEAQSCRCAEDNKHGDDEERNDRSVADELSDGYTSGARYHNVVDTHADVLGIVECRYVDVTSLPGQETSDHLCKHHHHGVGLRTTIEV